MTKALVLSGGSPNATLMAGALHALYEKGVKFDIISTAGYGAIVGLSYIAPRNGTPVEGLKNLINMGISDAIFDLFPVNYKVFHKPNNLPKDYDQFLSGNHFYNWLKHSNFNNLNNDLVQFFIKSFTPSNLNPKSLCSHPPFLNDIIDFDKLYKFDGEFYVNAYNITDQNMVQWGKTEITEKHLFAALAFPFIYEPVDIDGKKYYEGAVKEALNYAPLIKKYSEIESIVVIDIMGLDELIRVPKNLYDAWVISIMTPIIELAKKDTELFELKYDNDPKNKKLLKLKFNIPKKHLPQSLDWSFSNLSNLYTIGYQSGLEFYDQYKNVLSD